MKNHRTRFARAAWLLLAAPAFVVTPAAAQEAATAPPPVRATVPQASPPASAPVAQTPPPSRETGRPVEANTANPASRTTIAPGAADVVDDAIRAVRAERTPARQTTRTTTTRTTTTRAPAAAIPASAPSAAAPAPRAVTPAPAPAAAAAPAAPSADPAADTATTTTTTSTNEDGGAPLWPLALIAALIVAAGAFFLMRGRRAEAFDEEEAYYEEPAYVEPVAEPVRAAPAAIAAAPALDRVDAMGTPAAEPVAAEPVAAGLADEATVTDAPVEDVAALTEGAAPVRNRPWLEFAMRPVRAGTSADEAMVEIELTVANAGSVAARDVRVSTFMLTDTHASEMERMMVDAPADASIDPVTIAPGAGTRIDATLAALKSDLGADGHFNPVVVAEARYRLPDGSEGRTAASFVVGVTDDEGGTLAPIDLADRVMRDDIEARLHGQVEHA